MHICFVVYEYSATFNQPADLLEDYFSLTDWCELLAANDCKISALIRFKEKAHLKKGNIDYYFVPDAFEAQLKFWQIPRKLHAEVRPLQPDIIHTHNFNKVLQLRHLTSIAKGQIPILIQNHAETPFNWLRIQIQRRVFSKVDLFLLIAKGQEQPWLQHGLIPQHKIRYLIEASTHFELTSRALARQQSGLSGEPVFLWIGNLNTNKDPLTILTAFEAILSTHPSARLYMIYRFDELIEAVRSKIEASTTLSKAVSLLGPKKRSELPVYYNSANYFLLGSHREGSGYSAMEALACGCVPILTDIPAFRLLTDDGRVGQLWPCGDATALENAIRQQLAQPWEQASAAAHQHFEEAISYPAIGKKMMKYYQDLLTSK